MSRALLAVIALAIAVSSGASAQDPVVPDPSAAPPSDVASQETPVEPPVVRLSPSYDAKYHDLDAVTALVEAWIAADRGSAGAIVERVELASTARGVRVSALAFGARGDVALADRPTVLLIGGLDGVSLSGSEAVLSVTARLLADGAPALPPNVAFVAVPWASPEALARTLAGEPTDGRDLTPVDDDGDREVDEDGPDDLDGDEVVLDMLVEDPAGPWVRALDPRFLAAAREGDAPRYRRVREGRDDDQDGQYNEDPRGGVAFDRAFPIDWEAPGSDGANLAGRLPLEDPALRSLADFMLARKSVCAVFFQGNHGELRAPSARTSASSVNGPDAHVFEALARSFARATGRESAAMAGTRDASSDAVRGTAADWTYLVVGALAFEASAWGPGVDRGGEAPGGVALADAHLALAGEGASSSRAPAASLVDQAWARWLDNTRGGIGFVDWHPVELGNGRQALVGGWEPFARQNPPEKSLARALVGLDAFVLDVARSCAALEVQLSDVRRDGDVCTIRARVANSGALPTGIACTGRARWGTSLSDAGYGVRIELALPGDARLLAGRSEQWLGHLCGGGSSDELAWVVLAPPSSAFSLRVSSPWTSPIVREVKP